MFLVRFLGWLFSTASIAALAGAAAVGLFVYANTTGLPDYSQLRDYEPPVMTRVHAGDGELLAEYARERRLYLPIQVMPPVVVNAFLSAEDKNFYEHRGVDPQGVIRAMVTNLQNPGRRPQGASTITQQVAKNFLLTNEQSYTRKLKEAILAMRIEAAYTKDKILELYLNEIYLGMGNYGVAASALNYFGKSVNELTIAEAAYLAALPKAPNNYHPFRARDAAIERRNWVIKEMKENRFITADEMAAAQAEPLNVNPRLVDGAQQVAATYFAEEVRRELAERYGEKKLYEGGLSVRTTLDPALQKLARKALADGLVRFDEPKGYRGPVATVQLGEDWGLAVADQKRLNDIQPWRLGVVISVDDDSATVGLQPPLLSSGALSDERETVRVGLEGVRWARAAEGANRGRAIARVNQVLNVGDVIYVEPPADGEGGWRMRQVPEVSGAMVVMDPFTGRVLALVGGFSFDQSEFNRATQAMRQPGSSFKPFIYAAALDNGYTPSSVIMDAPIEISQGAGQEMWRPENYSGRFYGPQTLRFGIEYSRNVMTVRLAQDMGMPLIAEYARRFGIYDDLPPFLSMSLGSGETTVLRMTSAFGMLANGGRRIKPTLIDRIQDRWGHTIYKHDERVCEGCEAQEWRNQEEPRLVDNREQVIDPMTAYQTTSMLEGVVQRGTAQRLKSLNRPVAGKTGTTNDEKDVWFVGYSPDLVAGVYIGYDTPRPLGKGVSGGSTAAPIFGQLMASALKDKPPAPFRVPPGIKLIRIDPKSGLRASGGGRTILEAFKPGTAPPDSYSIIGVAGGGGGGGSTRNVAPDVDRALSSGTGGLY